MSWGRGTGRGRVGTLGIDGSKRAYRAMPHKPASSNDSPFIAGHEAQCGSRGGRGVRGNEGSTCQRCQALTSILTQNYAPAVPQTTVYELISHHPFIVATPRKTGTHDCVA